MALPLSLLSTNTLIRSTIDGMVLDVPVEVGNFVIETNNFNAGTTIASVADMGEMIFLRARSMNPKWAKSGRAWT